MNTTVDRTEQIWNWCRESYLRITGQQITLPKNTDPKKTYQWRYLELLNKKLTHLELDDDLCRKFIDITLRYAKKHNLVYKGLSIFTQNNLLQECYNKLREQKDNDETDISIIQRTKRWLDDQLAKSSCSNLQELLLRKRGIGTYTNIVRWYEGGNIYDKYLAISRSCGFAIGMLSRDQPTERSLLPKDVSLFLMRNELLSDMRIRFVLKNILQDDWRSPCRS